MPHPVWSAASAVFVSLMITGCAPEGIPQATAEPPPPAAAAEGQPKRVVLANGSAADVTVSSLQLRERVGRQYAVLVVDIVGRSDRPFSVDEEDFFWQWTAQPNVWRPDNSNKWGPQPELALDAPLRAAEVANGQKLHAEIGFLPGSAGGLLLVHEADESRDVAE